MGSNIHSRKLAEFDGILEGKTNITQDGEKSEYFEGITMEKILVYFLTTKIRVPIYIDASEN